MAQAKQNSKISTGAKVGIGAGVAALAAAAAGAYYFYGTENGSKKRKAMKGWMVKAKGEVMEKMEALKDVTEQNYGKIVEEVVKRYGKIKRIDPMELAMLGKEMRDSWKKISGHMKAAPRSGAKRKTPASKARGKK